MAVCLQTSFLTPPVGPALFYLQGVAPPGVELDHLYRGVIPFVLLQLLGICILFLFPDLVTWLPELMYGSSR
jgi:TRAP-type mannitol/chloroaromatic compound transport system permease large subunit